MCSLCQRCEVYTVPVPRLVADPHALGMAMLLAHYNVQTGVFSFPGCTDIGNIYDESLMHRFPTLRRCTRVTGRGCREWRLWVETMCEAKSRAALVALLHGAPGIDEKAPVVQKLVGTDRVLEELLHVDTDTCHLVVANQLLMAQVPQRAPFLPVQPLSLLLHFNGNEATMRHILEICIGCHEIDDNCIEEHYRVLMLLAVDCPLQTWHRVRDMRTLASWDSLELHTLTMTLSARCTAQESWGDALELNQMQLRELQSRLRRRHTSTDSHGCRRNRIVLDSEH